MNLSHEDVINYLRTLDREIARRAEDLTDSNHPMAAAHMEAANVASNHIESVCTLLRHREAELFAEWESRQPSRNVPDREVFNTP